MSTTTPGITDPVASVMAPLIVPVTVWAWSTEALNNNKQ